MINSIRNFVNKSEFIKNVLTLSSGTLIAHIITLFTAPLLYRIYDKTDYGTLGVYSSLVIVTVVFSSLQYLQPIIIEKDEKKAIHVLWLARIFNVIVSIITLLVIIFFNNNILELLSNNELSDWILLLPLSIFFTGQNEIMKVWANRQKYYKLISINSILIALFVPLISISLGLVNNGPLGLFVGLIFSQVLPSLILYFFLIKKDPQINYFSSYSNLLMIAKRYKDFPIYIVPSEFINKLANQLPVFMLSKFASLEVVAIYNLATRILGLPLQLLGGSVSEVFKKRAVEDYHKFKNYRIIFLKTLKSLFIISLMPVLVIMSFGPVLFKIVFGDEWYDSGELARILVWLFSFKLIVAPLSYAFYINNKLKEDFYLHLYMLLTNFIIFYVGFKFYGYETVLLIFVLNYISIYLYVLVKSFHFSKN